MILVALSLPLVANNVSAQDNEADDRTRLLAMLNSIETALNDQRYDALMPLLDENVVAIFLDGVVVRTPAEVTAYIDKFLGSDSAILKGFKTTAELGDQARFFGNIAVADGTSNDVFDLADGSQLTIDSVWSVTLDKSSGNWKIVQIHFSTSVFDNPIVEAANDRLMMIVSIAAVIALIVGLLLGRLGRRA
jgi:hypothetical protein